MKHYRICVIINENEFNAVGLSEKGALRPVIRSCLKLEDDNFSNDIFYITEGLSNDGISEKADGKSKEVFLQISKKLDVVVDTHDDILGLNTDKFDLVLLCAVGKNYTNIHSLVFACLHAKSPPVVVSSETQEAYSMESLYAQVTPDFSRKDTRIFVMDELQGSSYINSVHQSTLKQIVSLGQNAFQEKATRDPDVLIYREARLSEDLLQFTRDFQKEAYGGSFSIFQMMDKRIVYSPDYYNSLANYIHDVLKINNIENPKILDVGCGSGFLACYLKGKFPQGEIHGVDAAEPRVRSAKRHADLRKIDVNFSIQTMSKFEFPDNYFDLVCSTYALEQSGRMLGNVLKELARVSKRFFVLVEPTSEYFSTFPGMWHISRAGWANSYNEAFTSLGYSWQARPVLMKHYFNPGALFFMDKKISQLPSIEYPELFSNDVNLWPGGTKFLNFAEAVK